MGTVISGDISIHSKSRSLRIPTTTPPPSRFPRSIFYP